MMAVCSGAELLLLLLLLMSTIGSNCARSGAAGFLMTCTSGNTMDRHKDKEYLGTKVTTGDVECLALK